MTTIGRTTLWLAIAAIALNGHAFAQELGGTQATETFGATADVPAEARFSQEQIEQMVAPIALYPDALLAQVMMAATYPFEVAQADQWLKNNRGLEGEALDDAVAAQSWDPSVKTLAFFPDVLDRMAGDLTWTQDLGDAFLAQEADVMGAVQRLRREAQATGSLATNSQQRVRTEGSNILVESADPATVYVPSYNPTTVYGSGWAPTTTYYPDTYSSSYPTWVVFGAGVVVGALLMAVIDWADDDYYVVHRNYWPRRRHHHHIHYYGPLYWSRDWHGPRYGRPAWYSYRPTYINYGDVYIDKSRTVNVQKNVEVRRWEHNPAHRGTVSYRDAGTAQRFLKSGDAPRLEAEKVRRLERREPVALPADRGTREALTGDALERRDRIRRTQKEISPIGVVEERPDVAEAARRRLAREPERTEARETVRSRERERQLAAPGAPEATASRPNGARGRGEAPQAEAGRQQQRIEQREAGGVSEPRVERRESQAQRQPQPRVRQTERRAAPAAPGSEPPPREMSRETTREARTARRAEQAAPPQPVQERSSPRRAERVQPRPEARQAPVPERRQEAPFQRQSQPQAPRAEPRQAASREQPRVTERRQPREAAPPAAQQRERATAPAPRRDSPQARGSGDRDQRNRQREAQEQAGN